MHRDRSQASPSYVSDRPIPITLWNMRLSRSRLTSVKQHLAVAANLSLIKKQETELSLRTRTMLMQASRGFSAMSVASIRNP